MPNQEYGTVVY